jgi:uncharacterized protein YeaO (DUF488 family)
VEAKTGWSPSQKSFPSGGMKPRITGATPKAQEFEQRYMTELFANVDKTITVMDKLNELLTKVRKDCE